MKKKRTIYWIDGKKDYKKINQDRGNNKRNKDFYNSSVWIKLRDKVYEQQPLCVHCLSLGYVEPTATVDHIISLNDDWDKRLDITNLQGLCFKCHGKKEMEYKREKKNKKIELTMNDLNDFD